MRGADARLSPLRRLDVPLRSSLSRAQEWLAIQMSFVSVPSPATAWPRLATNSFNLCPEESLQFITGFPAP